MAEIFVNLKRFDIPPKDYRHRVSYSVRQSGFLNLFFLGSLPSLLLLQDYQGQIIIDLLFSDMLGDIVNHRLFDFLDGFVPVLTDSVVDVGSRHQVGGTSLVLVWKPCQTIDATGRRLRRRGLRVA